MAISLEKHKKPGYTYEYPHAAITSDSVVFGFDGSKLNILLIERGVNPHKGKWALPGGFMRIDETIEECAKRELMEETGLDDVYLEQFHVFSSVHRDPRERVVTVAFIAMVRKSEYHLLAGDDAAKACWFAIDELPELAFDHAEIVAMGRARLREVLQTRPIAFKFLDRVFSMTELQRIYEAINGTQYDRRNFAKKAASTGLLEKVADRGDRLPDIERIEMPCAVCEPTITPASALVVGATEVPAPQRDARVSSSALYTFDEEEYEEEMRERPASRNPFSF